MPGSVQREDVEVIYREYGHSVLRRAQRMLGTRHDADEVLQEVFASLIKCPQQFSGQSTITTWLYSATTHMCLNRIRDHKTRARLLAANPPQQDSEPARADSLAMAQQLLARLPRQQAEMFVYYFFDEMTHAEIADVVHCSRRQVGNLLARAAKVLEKEALR